MVEFERTVKKINMREIYIWENNKENKNDRNLHMKK